jgi:hypothetical protein
MAVTAGVAGAGEVSPEPPVVPAEGHTAGVELSVEAGSGASVMSPPYADPNSRRGTRECGCPS